MKKLNGLVTWGFSMSATHTENSSIWLLDSRDVKFIKRWYCSSFTCGLRSCIPLRQSKYMHEYCRKSYRFTCARHARTKYLTISSGSLVMMPLKSGSLVGRNESPAPRTWASSKSTPILKRVPSLDNRFRRSFRPVRVCVRRCNSSKIALYWALSERLEYTLPIVTAKMAYSS